MKTITNEHIEIMRSNGVTDVGIEKVFEIQEQSPVRRPNASKAGKNRTVRYPSTKMGFVIHTESETLEFAGALQLEFDDDTPLYWSQPSAINLRYKSGKRNVTINTVLDFFVISKKFVGYIEWKNAEKLSEVAKKSPDRFYFDEKTCEFYSPAIARSIADTGFGYKICYEKHASPCLISNLEYLNGYFSTEPEKELLGNIEKAVAELKKCKRMSYQELCSLYGGDCVNYALAQRKIHFPISEIRLVDTINGVVFSDEDECRKYRKKVSLLDREFDKSAFSETFLKASELEIQKAVRKLDVIERKLSGELSREQAAYHASVDMRTISRWQKSINGLFDRTEKLNALLDKNSGKGNRSKKLHKQVDKLIRRFLEEFFLTKVAPNAHFVFGILKRRCKTNNLPVPSSSTFYRYINALTDVEVEFHRRGEKAAYQHTGFEFIGVDEEIRMGATRFLQYCHIDHTLVDVEIISDLGVEMPLRPWITLIVDEFTGMILGSFLSYQKPSYVAVMMVIRLMVILHGVLPECVVVDGGKEFEGTSFELLLAALRIAVKSRKGQPRGIIVERTIGMLNTTFFHNIQGNTKYTKDVRSLSRTHNPKVNAKWTLCEISEMLEWYICAYNEGSVKSQSLSPVKMRDLSLKLFGERRFLRKKYDKALYVLTLPSVSASTVTLRRGRPVKFDNLEYWNSKFNLVSEGVQKIPAKWDPLDAQVLFVYLRGEWIECALSQRLNRPLDGNRAVKSEQLREETRINLAAKRAAHGDLAGAVEDAIEHISEKRILSEHSSAIAEEDHQEVVEENHGWLENIWQAKVPGSKFKGGV